MDKLVPPTSAKQPQAAAARPVLSLLAALTAVFCAWNLLGLPGALIHKYNPPADIPWFGFGLKRLIVSNDGTWMLQRLGYADRMQYYRYAGDRLMSRQPEFPQETGSSDAAGIIPRMATVGSPFPLVVKPSRQYYEWRQQLGAPPDEAQHVEEQAGAAPDESPQHEPNVQVVTGAEAQQRAAVLSGRQFFAVFDSAAYLPPFLWLTTDRVTMLHRLRVDALTPVPNVVEVVSQPLADQPADASTILGIDPTRDQLFILDAAGRCRWFDKLTLESRGAGQLGGCWEKEYASLLGSGNTHSFYTGYPLAEAGYARIMRGLMLALLASLLLLINLWSKGWKFTSARTTAASTPSASSANSPPA